MTISTTKNNSSITTTSNQKRTRNRKRNNTLKDINADGSGSGSGPGGKGGPDSGGSGTGGGGVSGSRVRRKGRQNPKKKEEKLQKTYAEIITKPVIESSNPFFIAVCAPETYKPAMNTTTTTSIPLSISGSVSGYGSGIDNSPYEGRPRTNVFLRSRPVRNTTNLGSSYPNRFIHHPIIQNLRQIDTNTNTNTETRIVDTEPCVSSNDLKHFPSLGGADNTNSNTSIPISITANAGAGSGTGGGTGSKLNFKEMVMRNSSGLGVGSVTDTVVTTAAATAATASSSSTSLKSNMVSYRITPQKSLSSSNIFLAAFHCQDGDDVDYGDDDYNEDEHYQDQSIRNGGSSGGRVFASSVLIDSCDRKYDKLYK